jgi:5-methyltetrahydrofolate--homocysteine methyltransferase
MARLNLKKRIRQGLFLLDGAMGTQLIARGIDAGGCSDYLNIASPATILEIHKAYIDAGSDAVLTNTFGANSIALARHGHAREVDRVNIAGAEIARRAAGKDKYVLGDIGPSGDFLEPLGKLTVDELRSAFTRQAEALLAGGVDGFIIETMTAIDELAVAIEAVKSVCAGLPVFASMAFDGAGGSYHTMMGVDVSSAVSKMVSLGVDAVGFNCGTVSLSEYVELTEKYVSAIKTLKKSPVTSHDKSQVTVFAEPNAGRPELVGTRAVYSVSPEEFAATAEKIYSAGIKIIGGCCGTGPEHIAAVSKKLRK